ncbi:MAG: hypothetical protein ICV68_16925, partial [Pyrinomonadaceae bacterium]|nr:hypothetical protein [Pyrinomonadaceae bacterium]
MNEIEKVLNPNVYAFAFHLIGGASGRNNPLWNWGDDFLESFTSQKLKPLLKFPEEPSNLSVDLLPDISLDFNTKV